MMRKCLVLFLTMLLLLALTPQLLAVEAVQPGEGLTIEEAINMAWANSQDLMQSDLDIEKAEKDRESIAKFVKFIPLESSGSTDADTAYTNLVAADISHLMSKKTRGMNEDKVALSTFNAYVGVIQAGQNLQYHENALKKAQLDWRHANLKHQLGLISRFEKDLADSGYLNAQKAVGLAQDRLTTAYQAFNKLIGLSVDKRPLLSEKPAYSEMEIDDLEAAVNRIVYNNPAIWLSEQMVDLAKLQKSLLNLSASDANTRRSAEIGVEKADLSSAQAKTDFRQAVRDIYYNIQALETAYTLQNEGVKLAQQGYDIAKLNYELGMATGADLQEAKTQLEKAVLDLDGTIYQHEYLKMVFAKPWAAMV